MAISKRWSAPEARFKAWHRGEEQQPFALGEVQFVPVAENLWVANLVGQRDIRVAKGVPLVRYDAIREGFKKVALEAHRLRASVHMPRIGCGLAGGDWQTVGKIVEEELVNADVPVIVYDFSAG